METDIITKLSIIAGIIGIILLIVISDKISVSTSEVSSISKEDINKIVKIRGSAKEVTNKDKIAFITLEDKTGTIKIIAFKPNNLSIKKGSFIEVEGKVSLYEGVTQVYAETIKIIN